MLCDSCKDHCGQGESIGKLELNDDPADLEMVRTTHS